MRRRDFLKFVALAGFGFAMAGFAMDGFRSIVHAQNPVVPSLFLASAVRTRTNILNPNDSLNPGESVTSPNGRYSFIYQGDGNLALYRNSDGRRLWVSGTTGWPAGVCIMQNDGNLVIVRYWFWFRRIISVTNTHVPGSRLVVQDDGNVVVYDPNNTPLWDTDTVHQLASASLLPFTNWGKNFTVVPLRTFIPEYLHEIVTIVRKAEARDIRVHAFGSKWSFSDCAIPIVSRIRRILLGIILRIPTGYSIDTTHLNLPIQTVQKALNDRVLAERDSELFYHVEAGITIKDLYEKLNKFVGKNGPRPLALETMGGASGQTLAGAISTGTHGMDKNMSPLADSVVAIHMVGAGGTQYWIEPSQGITDPSKLREFVAPDVDADNIIYNDSIFEAVLVSMGCMGIIYSVVLRVRKQYSLIERTEYDTWQGIQPRLSYLVGTSFFRSLQIIINPYTDSKGQNFCLVTTRWEGSSEGKDACSVGNLDQAVQQLAFALIAAAGPSRTVQLGLHLIDSLDKPREQVLVDLTNLILDKAPDLRKVLIDNYRSILEASWPATTCGGISYKVMDLKNRDPENGGGASSSIGGNSTEMFFPATRDKEGRFAFVSFVNAMITAFNTVTNTFLGGYVALRFTGKTRAWLGMQQWERTCAVEISALPGIKGMQELLAVILAVMYQHGGKPHWGQQIDMTVQGHGSIYRQFEDWRRVYKGLSKDFNVRTFENALSRRWQLTLPTVVPPEIINTPPFSDGEDFRTRRDPKDLIKIRVFENAVPSNEVEFVLKAGPGINWRKEIVIKESPAAGPGTWTIFVMDNIDEDRNGLYTYQLPGAKLIFRKVRFVGRGGPVVLAVGEKDITNMKPGTRVEFTWEKD